MSVLADSNAGLLRNHAGLGLHALYRGHHLALLYPVAFFDVEVGNPAERGGSDVDVGLGLDLARAADDGDQVFPHHLGSEYFGVTRLGANDGKGGDADRHQDHAGDDQYLLQFHG